MGQVMRATGIQFEFSLAHTNADKTHSYMVIGTEIVYTLYYTRAVRKVFEPNKVFFR